MSFTADVIMPIRNGARFIVPALQSILGDTALATLIIVDDGSTDNWEDLAAPHLAAHKGKTLILRQKASGVAAALNRGLKASTTPYVARMDADDVSLPGRLSAQISYLNQHPEIHAVGTQAAFINAEGHVTGATTHPCAPAPLRHMLLARARCTIVHPSIMMRRDSIIAAGGYRESIAHAEDYDLWLRLSETHAVSNMPDILLQYRIHPDQVSQSKKLTQSFYRDLALFSAREREAGRPDPAAEWSAPPSHLDALRHPNPTCRNLGLAHDAIAAFHNNIRHPLAGTVIQAISELARQKYLGETRRFRYRIIKAAGTAALRNGNIPDAISAFYALARCRASDSKLFRPRSCPGEVC